MNGDDKNGRHALTLEGIYREHWRYVWRCVRRMGVPEGRLEDVTQDVFIVAGRNLATFEGRSSIQTWLYSIAFRVAQEHHRKHLREQRPDPHVAKLAQTPEDQVQQREAAATLHTLLGDLDEDQRRIFVQIEIEGVPAADLAEAHGLSVNTIYSRLRLARRKVERALARHQARLHAERKAVAG